MQQRSSWVPRILGGGGDAGSSIPILTAAPIYSHHLHLETTSLTQEITGLEALEVQMSRRVKAFKTNQDRAAFGRTIRGRIWNFFGGWAFGGYCAYRIVNVCHLLQYTFEPS